MRSEVSKGSLFKFEEIRNRDVEPTRYKVLVVDDEEPIRKLIANILSLRGHQYVTAKDGREALDKMMGAKFDALVTDIAMPEMDGLALTKEIATHYQNFPVMVMTGYAEEYPPETAMTSGAREFIRKPFSVSEFIIRFDQMMRDHEREEALVALSLTDELTGLSNRRRFFVLAEQCLKVAVRTKKRSLLLYIDMDDLKWINDHRGHNEGDQALIALGKILKKTFRESDIIARIGGDEFAVLLESTDENEDILTTRLNENIKDYNTQAAQEDKLSVSVGAAEFNPEDLISIDELLSKADALMYAQKRKRAKKEFQVR